MYGGIFIKYFNRKARELLNRFTYLFNKENFIVFFFSFILLFLVVKSVEMSHIVCSKLSQTYRNLTPLTTTDISFVMIEAIIRFDRLYFNCILA